ncbi:hypothetical protein C7C56_010855 [Massilia glaciei]|uniref:Uncharacterized protein n=1 Tax=Massilia glaciei TaxID=1524097 RepID=A0A2U2HM51_9BURK|nr:hypothetical protein C7C56_010855 [Massilia glaciei]
MGFLAGGGGALLYLGVEGGDGDGSGGGRRGGGGRGGLWRGRGWRCGRLRRQQQQKEAADDAFANCLHAGCWLRMVHILSLSWTIASGARAGARVLVGTKLSACATQQLVSGMQIHLPNKIVSN